MTRPGHGKPRTCSHLINASTITGVCQAVRMFSPCQFHVYVEEIKYPDGRVFKVCRWMLLPAVVTSCIWNVTSFMLPFQFMNGLGMDSLPIHSLSEWVWSSVIRILEIQMSDSVLVLV